MALRSGRPSAIFDEEISCHIPSTAEAGNTVNVELVTYYIHLSQIVSRIVRRLNAVTAIHTPIDILRQTTCELGETLRKWKDSISASMQPQDSIKLSYMKMNEKPLSVLNLHLAYYGTVLGLHTLFTTPWISRVLLNPSVATSSRAEELGLASPETVIDAARNIIILSSQMQVDAASTQW